ncbi:uncharacterized protein LOC131323827 [Rhododendron vialii]|uniref:uncharacterized protein LOC131323827 n=1 Tax=Rhododendron vialii TaxID=182163 RepID=UPI00265F81DE|nr:uncharacterized protein LOC131323827 [Rhododendron vialii]
MDGSSQVGRLNPIRSVFPVYGGYPLPVVSHSFSLSFDYHGMFFLLKGVCFYLSSAHAPFPLTSTAEAELRLAQSYKIHSWGLLVTLKSLATYLLGPEISQEEGEGKEMTPKMDKALLAQLKAERAKQSFGAVAPKRKSSRLQRELNVESFLDADLSNDPALDLVVGQIVEGDAEKSKRKVKGAAVESTPLAKKSKTVVGPSILGNY